jgi:hypothetical protein
VNLVAVCVTFGAIYGLSAYLVFTFIWRREDKQHARDLERDKRERELMEYALNPRAAEAAAFARALEDMPPPPPDTDLEDDDRYGRDVTQDFDFLAIGDEA